MLTNRGKAVLGAASLVLVIVLAFVLARLTTHSGTPVAHQSTSPVVPTETPTEVDSPTPTDESLSDDPTATGSASSTTSVSASASGSGSASATASGTPSVSASTSASATDLVSPSTPASAPPATVAQLAKEVTGCAAGTCKVIKTFISAGSTPLRFALVQLPAPKGTFEVPLRAVLFDTKTQKVTWSSDVLTGAPATGTDGGAAQDATGHIAFTLIVGAHSSSLYVLDPGNGTKVKWFGQSNDDGSTGYFSDTPDAHAQDIDGDGILEVLLPENDYTPDYATGNTTVYRYAWEPSQHDYLPAGCTYYPSGAKTGTDYDVSDPKCAAG